MTRVQLRFVLTALPAAALVVALAGCGATPSSVGSGQRAAQSAAGTGRGAVRKTGQSLHSATQAAKSQAAKGALPWKSAGKTAGGPGGASSGVGKSHRSGKAASSMPRPKAPGNKSGVKPMGALGDRVKGTRGKRGATVGQGSAPAGRGGKGAKGTPSASAPTRLTPAMAAQGATLYTASKCASCHGPQGSGTSSAPALNGTGSVPVTTTYPTPEAMATFIHQNMPLTNPGSLTASQADELAAYIYYTLNHRSK